jgi:probable HAF family extracellular repeat protein
LCPAPPVYVVRAGDNLWDIAKLHGVSVEALLAGNPQIGDRRVIRVGDEITISPIDLGTLGGDSSRASAINNRGQIVGTSDTASDGRHAFLWQDGEMTDLGTLGGGFSEAVAINDRGQVVGTSDTASNRRHAFLWENGSMIDLGTLGYSSEAVAINDGGQVVGWSEVAPTVNDLLPRHAFLWQAGAMIDLGTLGGDSSEAVAINDRGQVVGTIDQQHAFLWEAGTMTDLGPAVDFHGVAVTINDSGQIAIVRSPGAAVAINDHGQIVGGRHLSDMVVPGEISLWQDGTTTNLGPLDGAFSWRDGTMTALGSLGDDRFSVASAVNSRGQVVGSSLTAYPDPIEWEWCCSTLFHAFLWQNGSMIDLGDLGPLASRTSSDAAAINDCGHVVGSSARTPGANGPWTPFAQAPEHAALWYAPVP